MVIDLLYEESQNIPVLSGASGISFKKPYQLNFLIIIIFTTKLIYT